MGSLRSLAVWCALLGKRGYFFYDAKIQKIIIRWGSIRYNQYGVPNLVHLARFQYPLPAPASFVNHGIVAFISFSISSFLPRLAA